MEQSYTSFIGETNVCTPGTALFDFCTATAAKSTHQIDGLAQPKLLVSFTNFGYFDMAHNFVEALNRLGIYNVVMFALDIPSYERFKLLGIPTWLLASKESTVYTQSSSSFGSPEFNSICNVKPWIVVECLRGGFDVVWTDTDVIWLRDCQPFFDINPTVDLQLQGDDDDICAGFFYARSTDANIRLLDKVLTYVNTCMDDQTALRRFLHEEEGFAHRLTVKPDDLAMTHAIDWTRGPQTFELKEGVSNYAVLPRAAFPNGTAYFNVKLPQRFGLVPYVVHNNCIIGHDSKVDRFRMYNMWFIAEPVDVTFEKASNELNSHSPVLSLTPHREVVTHLSISPDGKTLYTSAYDKTVKTYRIETIKEAIDKGEVQLKPSGGGLLNRRGGVWCMAWAPSHAEAPQAAALSTLASALGSAGVSSSALAMLSHPTTDAKEPSTEPICITGGHDRHLMVWSTHDGLASDTFANQGPWVLQHTMKGHQGIVNDLCFHRDLVFSASDDCTVRSWDIKKGEKTRIYRAGNGWMSSLAADGPALFAASSDGCAYAWEIASARLMQVYVGHIGWVRTIAVHGASKRVYTAGADGNIKEWDMVSGDCKRTLRSAHSAGINKIALHHSETGKLLLDSASDDGLVRTWDVETLACIEDFEGCTGSVNTIVRQGNLLIAGCADHTVKVWKSNL